MVSSRRWSTIKLATFGPIVRNQPRRSALGGPYFGVVYALIGVAVLFAILAVVLSVYVDSADSSKETIKDSIGILWHCVTLLVGGLVGLLAGPRLTTVQTDVTAE